MDDEELNTRNSKNERKKQSEWGIESREKRKGSELVV